MTDTSPSLCICIAMRKASRKLTAFYDAALEPTGVNIAQFSLLRKLRRYGALSLTALSELVELDRSTLGRNLRVLEKQGLLELKPGKDQRESIAELTDAGRNTLAAGDPLWDRAQADIAARVGTDGITQLEALLWAL